MSRLGMTLIAGTFAAMTGLSSVSVSVCVGEGGSGGALALAHADRLLIQEHAVFSVIAPEGAAAILERDAAKAPQVAPLLKLTSADLLQLGIVDCREIGMREGVGVDLPSRSDQSTNPARREPARIGLLAHLETMGAVVRDLESGLVDIPTERDGEPVWFCWRLGDPELAFWHSTSEGFANRKPW